MSFFGGHIPDTDRCLHCIMALTDKQDRLSKLRNQFAQSIESHDDLHRVHDWFSDIVMIQKHLSTRDPELINQLIKEFLEAGLLLYMERVTVELIDCEKFSRLVERSFPKSTMSVRDDENDARENKDDDECLDESESEVDLNHQSSSSGQEFGILASSSLSSIVSGDQSLLLLDNLRFKIIVMQFQIIQTVFKEQFMIPEEIEMREKQLDEMEGYFHVFYNILLVFTKNDWKNSEVLNVFFQTLQTIVILSYKTGFVKKYEEKSAHLVVHCSHFLHFFRSHEYQFVMEESTQKLIELIEDQVLMAMIAILPIALVDRFATIYSPVLAGIIQLMEELLKSRNERGNQLEHCAEILSLLLYFPCDMIPPYSRTKLHQWHGYTMMKNNPTVGTQLFNLFCEVRSTTITEATTLNFKVEHYLLICIANLSQLMQLMPDMFSGEGSMIAETIMDLLYSNLEHDKTARSTGLFDTCIEKKAIVVQRNSQSFDLILMHPTFRECALITIMNLSLMDSEVTTLFSPFVHDWKKLGHIICDDMEQRSLRSSAPLWFLQFAMRAIPFDEDEARRKELLKAIQSFKTK